MALKASREGRRIMVHCSVQRCVGEEQRPRVEEDEVNVDGDCWSGL